MPLFRVGTSGWHYRHWLGSFYPADLEPREWLRHYAARFDTVELNNSFYRLPKESAWRLWRETAPPGFVFAVKASRYVTHLKRLLVEPASIERFFAGARLLGEHLGPVLYQLPLGFARSGENEERLVRFLGQLPPGFTHVFEFRSRSWFAEETFALLDEHRAAFCSFDLPGLECPLRVTGGVLYMRFHGSGARYGGRYSARMLRKEAVWIGARLDSGLDVYAYFNNDAGGHAPRDALRLKEFVG